MSTTMFEFYMKSNLGNSVRANPFAPRLAAGGRHNRIGTMPKIVDLNCDLGEGFGHWDIAGARDEDLMEVISSANVAAGFHAGDPSRMNQVADLCRQHSVGLGVHPGYRDLVGFGRRRIEASVEELVNDILYQVGALREFGRRYGIALQHIKPHGALYMEAARNDDLSRHLVETLRRTSPELPLFCMDISRTCEIAVQHGHPVVREFYADRDYDDSGSIVFQRHAGRLDPRKVAQKCLRACLEGRVETVTGREVAVSFESICFHSDTPGALEIGRAIKALLRDNGIRIAPAAMVLQNQ